MPLLSSFMLQTFCLRAKAIAAKGVYPSYRLNIVSR